MFGAIDSGRRKGLDRWAAWLGTGMWTRRQLGETTRPNSDPPLFAAPARVPPSPRFPAARPPAARRPLDCAGLCPRQHVVPSERTNGTCASRRPADRCCERGRQPIRIGANRVAARPDGRAASPCSAAASRRPCSHSPAGSTPGCSRDNLDIELGRETPPAAPSGQPLRLRIVAVVRCPTCIRRDRLETAPRGISVMIGTPISNHDTSVLLGRLRASSGQRGFD
jgi:hypothetical protein